MIFQNFFLIEKFHKFQTKSVIAARLIYFFLCLRTGNVTITLNVYLHTRPPATRRAIDAKAILQLVRML